MNNETSQKEITKRLDAIIRLLVASSLKDTSITEKIYFLQKSGFSPKEISEILNTTANYVSVILSNMRKREKKKVGATIQGNEEKNIVSQDPEVQNG